MAIYLIKARPKLTLLDDLKKKLQKGEIYRLQPFGNELELSLKNAKLSDDGYAYWVEEDYCSPPLKMEREAVLDEYFDDIEIVEQINGIPQIGWEKIKDISSLWKEKL